MTEPTTTATLDDLPTGGQPSTTSTITTVLGDVVIESVNPASINQFWGSIASQMGQSGIMGEHSSAAGTFTPDPGDGGRQGVGNLSKNDPRFLPDGATGGTGDALANGAQGFHATFQAARLGDPDSLPPGAIEGTVGPFFPEAHGSVTIISSPETLQITQAIAGFAPQEASQTTALPPPQAQPSLDLTLPR